MVQDQALTAAMRDLAQAVLTELSVQGMLQHLVTRIVEVVPATMVGLVLLGPGGERNDVAASHRDAVTLEELQFGLREGPALHVVRSLDHVVVDLHGPTPFPAFAARARAHGVERIAALPLRHDDAVLGALTLYSRTADGLDGSDLAAARLLADVAAAYLVDARFHTELKDSAERLQTMALHDALTSLPNRLLFRQRLEHGLQRAERSGRLLAVLFVDLDHFKAVNDLYGHAAGDDLLVGVARRTGAVLRPGDTLARLSGDEFAILCEDLTDAAQVEVLADRITAQLREPFVLDEAPHRVTASIGITFGGLSPNTDPEDVMRMADAAMYQAKRAGGDRHRVIDLRTQPGDERTSQLHRDLAMAANGDGLSLSYQPIVDTEDGHVVGLEALLRWHHPRQGDIETTTLIALAEECGVIDEIGRWVLRNVLENQRGWRHLHPAPGVAIKVAPPELMAHHYVAHVAELLRATGCDPSMIMLEITENAFSADPERALVVLKDLHELGVRIALDDFGTGSSSLTALQRFPVDVVKIDRSFVASLGDPTSDRMVSAIIDLAHDLDLAVVAAGVERPDQHRRLAERHCDYVQGFYVGDPRPASAIEQLIE